MKRLLFSGALFLVTFSFAQRPIFSYEPARQGDLKSVATVDEQSNSIYLTLIQRNSIERIQLSPSGKSFLLHQGSEPKEEFITNSALNDKLMPLFYHHNYIGNYLFGKKMIEVVQFRQFYDLVFVETDLVTGASVSTDTLKIYRKDDLLLTYTRNEQLFFVEKPKGKSYFLFHRKTYGKKLTTDTMHVNLPPVGRAGNDLFEGKIENFGDVTIGSDVQVLPNNLWFPVHALNYRNKAFIQKDKFFLTINCNDLTTWVVTVDLNTFTHNLKKFNRHVEGLPIDGTCSNAALVIDSFLITAIANKNAVHYAVYNHSSEDLLYRQTIEEANFSEQSTSPVMKVGDFWSRSNLSEISLNEFVSKSKENQLIINGYREKEQLFLTFGSMYKMMFSATFLGNLLTLGAGNFAQVKPPTTVYFHSALNLQSFTPSKSITKTAVWDKMLNHLFANRRSHAVLNFFYLNGYYYLGYFSSIKREYELYRFSEKTE